MVENVIFDNNRTKYVFIAKWNSIIITDENGNQLAKAKGSSLFDNGGSLILKVDEYDQIKDSKENLIGLFLLKDEIFFLKNSKDEDILLGEQNTVYDIPYGINNNAGEKIADETWKGNWIQRCGGLGDVTLRIHDLSFDRKALLGFVWQMMRFGKFEFKDEGGSF